ncbi:MAG: tRNA ((37)-N6)-threonylcarbamoyltransferase complex ATPase subunit type 1 TsaE [Bacteroidota bacterium]
MQSIRYKLNEIPNIAKMIVDLSRENNLFLFYGEVGAGKTTLIKEICKQLGVQDNTSSPSFSIINEYIGALSPLYHIDLYRLNKKEEALIIGIEDYLFSGHICLIEWPQIIVELIAGEHYVSLQLSQLDQERRISISVV